MGFWDNWVCIKSRALGVKVDRRSQSKPAGLELGARERTEVLVLQNTFNTQTVYSKIHWSGNFTE